MDIFESIRDFYVFVEDDRVVGVAALNICWEDLAEVRSLVVHEDVAGRGIGSRLVEACLSEARQLGIGRVFALTYQQSFFEKLGFEVIEKSELPQKIWSDCIKCVKFPDCDEIALNISL
jgi:amino-acid N-acetyltransferase